MKTTLVLREEIVVQAKQRAAALGITLSEFTERSLRDALTQKSTPGRRIVLPTTGHVLEKSEHSVAEIKRLETDDPR